MRPKGGQTDYEEPLIMREDATIGNVCDKLHRRMRKAFRYGMVWGKSVKFGGQRVGISHRLLDGDVLTIVKNKIIKHLPLFLRSNCLHIKMTCIICVIIYDHFVYFFLCYLYKNIR